MKPRNDFEKLVHKYANGREICNCGEGYYTNGRCKYGCSTNKIRAKEEIATKVCKEFNI
jgi:hypothetical protein